MMRYFSTFSGIGGFEIGISNAFARTRLLQGIDHSDSSTAHGLRSLRSEPLCVGYSEIDKYAISVFEQQFKGVKNYGDITKIDAGELPEFDCLVGGFPCQAFSIAGKRRGFEDTRGTLFFDLARILRAKQPKLFVFENVKGLLSHDNGNTFKTIIAAVDELGYDCQWQVINSKNHGVPQNRERIIIVGHLRGTSRPEVFPLGVGTGLPTEGIGERSLTGGIASTITTNYHKGVHSGGETYVIATDSRLRRLTPLECERLQGFPDEWTKYNDQGQVISDTQRYKMCGNAVTTNVIRDVFERIFVNSVD
jgi:DNA (cytosine-5)-methyltransferase 1